MPLSVVVSLSKVIRCPNYRGGGDLSMLELFSIFCNNCMIMLVISDVHNIRSLQQMTSVQPAITLTNV